MLSPKPKFELMNTSSKSFVIGFKENATPDTELCSCFIMIIAIDISSGSNCFDSLYCNSRMSKHDKNVLMMYVCMSLYLMPRYVS